MYLQCVYPESFTFHLFESQNVINVQAVRLPKNRQYQTMKIDSITIYYTRALEISSQSTNKTHNFPS